MIILEYTNENYNINKHKLMIINNNTLMIFKDKVELDEYLSLFEDEIEILEEYIDENSEDDLGN